MAPQTAATATGGAAAPAGGTATAADVASALSPSAGTAMVHPLDPVTPDEMTKAVGLLAESKKATGTIVFSSCRLLEPSKPDYFSFKAGGPAPPRVVVLVGVDEAGDGGLEARVDVSAGTVEVRRLPGTGQPSINAKDTFACMKILSKSESYLEALRKRGIEDPKTVEVEPWPGGGYAPADLPKGHRAWRCIFFQKLGKNDNCYARPIPGLIAHVDVTAMKLHRLEDHGFSKVPSIPHTYDRESQGQLRTDLKPIEVVQPEGPSFEVDGNRVTWAGWDFRIGTHPINGLVLHDISFRGRPLLYRASLSDMVVPYGDRDPQHSWKHVLDGSEANILGFPTNSLKLGCDCLGEIKYFDVNYIGYNGQPVTVENGICMHEEDTGIQWKHRDNIHANVSEVRRGRRLVVSSFSTVGNYDYGWYWHFQLDGEIELEVKLTGILSAGGLVKEGVVDQQFQAVVAPGITAPVHQHLFNVRLDWNLDGGPNSLEESNIEALPVSDENPDGTQFRAVSRLLETESQAKRNIAPEVNRNWKIVNRGSKNSFGKAVAYKVLPGASQRMFAKAESVPGRRAAFGLYNLWATAFAEGELMAAGDHTVMSEGGDGLPHYTRNDRSLVDCDLVTWHTVGVTHVPRPEDWPVMPVERARLNLIPVGFFDASPVMDLPLGKCHNHHDGAVPRSKL